MSSTNKTARLNLCQWVGSDVPKMADFNSDNQLVDTALAAHLDDGVCHLTAAERSLALEPFLNGSYQGDGQASRILTLNFAPRFGVVFPMSNSPCEFDFDVAVTLCSFGFLTPLGASLGLERLATGFRVRQISPPAAAASLPFLNSAGVLYCYAMWK